MADDLIAPVVRIQPVHDGEKGHGVLRGVDDQLEVGVAQLGQEHVHPGTLLEAPPVLVLEEEERKYIKY